jgi:Xaa-Pro dipeptidase
MRDTDFPRSEYQQRYERAWHLMPEQGLAALLVTSEANYRYLTGHRTQFWVSRARPMLAVLPQGRPPIPVITEIERAVIRDSSWLEDVRTWFGFADDSVPVLADLLRELDLGGERVGVDYGAEMRLGLPVPTFETLQALVKDIRFVDGSPVLWALRQIKSPREIAYKRQAFEAAAAGFRRCWRAVRAGMTEREIQRRMMVSMLEAGADRVGWLPIHSGPGNYAKFSAEPSDRRVRPGDVIWMDAGCTVHGYWSDYGRIAVVGQASANQADAYRRIWEITRACVEAMRPGIPVSDIVKVRDAGYARMGFVETGSRSGRMGHGSGLEITEPPSVGAHDHTILRPGMVIHIEPKMILPWGFFQLEEAVVVTARGSDYLTAPAPERLPVVARPAGRR